jgi:hypothetical protein
MLSLKFQFISLHGNVKSTAHLSYSFNLVVHGSLAELDDWSHDELDEASLKSGFIVSFIVVLPLFGFGIKVVVTPKLFHHFFSGNTEFL